MVLHINIIFMSCPKLEPIFIPKDTDYSHSQTETTKYYKYKYTIYHLSTIFMNKRDEDDLGWQKE